MIIKSKCFSILSIGLIGLLLLAGCAPAAQPTPGAPSKGETPTKPTLSPTPLAAATPTVSGAPRHGGILTTNLFNDPPHFDVHQETGAYTELPASGAYNLLVQVDPSDDSKIITDLAEKWEISNDGLVYTFPLRKDVKFHDGTPLTSADVKVSFDRNINPPKGIVSPRQSMFGNVSKFEAPDAYTVKFTLKRPQAAFLEILAVPFNVIMPSHILAAKGDMKKDLIGTGPFKLKDYVPGVMLKMEKVPDYFIKDRPYLDGITWYIIRDSSAVLSALRTGTILMSLASQQDFKPREIDILKREIPGVVAGRFDFTSIPSLFSNVTKAPWNDIRVRKAIDLAIDRQKIVELNEANVGGKVGGYMPPGPWEFPESELLSLPGYRQPKDQDIAEAKKLLADAGFPNGMKITVPCRAASNQTDIMTLLKDQLRAINVDVTIQPMEAGAHKQLLFAGDFGLAFHSDGATMVDPDVLFNEMFVTGSTKNYGKYSNPKVDELWEKQSMTMDPAERKKLVLDLQKLAMADYPRSIIYWRSYATIVWPSVKNFVASSRGVYYHKRFDFLWLAK